MEKEILRLRENKLFAITGKSGSGKDTQVKKFEENLEVSIITSLLAGSNKILPEDSCEIKEESYPVKRAVLDTSRPMRENEVNGVTYNFISYDEFVKNINSGKYLEYREYQTAYGTWYYGTPIDAIDLEKSSYVIPITPNLIQKLNESFDPSSVVVVNLNYEKKELFKRCISREIHKIVHSSSEYLSQLAIYEIYRRVEDDSVRYADSVSSLLNDKNIYVSVDDIRLLPDEVFHSVIQQLRLRFIKDNFML